MVDIDTIVFFGKSEKTQFKEIRLKRDISKWWEPFLPGEPKNEEDKYRIILGERFMVPNGRKWGLKQEQLEELEKYNRIKIENGNVKYAPLWTILKNNWTDIPGYSRNWGFLTENSEILLKRVTESTSNEYDLVMDFFLGSGTTTAVAHKFGRKWIGVEMGDHFDTVVLPRMKKVLAYDKSGISKEDNVKEKYNENNAGGFFKYYDLEQYEQTLRRCHYIPSEPFFDLDDKSIYEQYIFFKDHKLLDAMELNYNSNKIKVRFDNIYPNIDIAETLSNLKGKWIKKINKDSVILKYDNNNEEKIKFDNIDFKTIKPLIWW